MNLVESIGAMNFIGLLDQFPSTLTSCYVIVKILGFYLSTQPLNDESIIIGHSLKLKTQCFQTAAYDLLLVC